MVLEKLKQLKSSLLLFLLTSIVIPVFAAPINAPVSPPVNTAQPILIGATYNITGDDNILGKLALKGLFLAEKSINNEGGIKGRPLTIVFRDGKSDPKEIKKIATEFANNPQIVAVIGLPDIDTLSIAAPIIAKKHKLIISTGSTSPYIIQKIPKYLYLISFTDNVQAAAAAEYAYSFLKAHSAVILYDQDSQYGKNLQSFFKTRYEQLKGKIVLDLSFHEADKTIQDQIQQILSLKKPPDCIYLTAGSDEAPNLIKVLRHNGLMQNIIGGDGFISHELLEKAGDAANNVSFTTHGIVNPDLIGVLPGLMRQFLATKKFFTLYKKTYGAPPVSVFSSLAYDGLNLLADIMRVSPSLNTESLIKTIHTLDNYVGVTGELSYLNGQKAPLKTVSIVRIVDGTAVFVGEWVPIEVPKP